MRALVLSGGGANGAWQAGVIQYLMEQGYQYPIVCGVSVGALNGAMLCEYPLGQERAAAERVLQQWKATSTNSIYKKWWCNLLPAPLGIFLKGSAYNTEPLQNIVRSELNVEAVRTSGKHFVVGAVRWGATSDYQTFDHNFHDLPSAILASSAMPIFFEDVKIGDGWYTDGGLRDVTPILAAIKAGATHIDVVSCSTGHLTNGPERPKGLDKLLRSFSIAIDEIDRSDFEITRHINARVLLGDPEAERKGWRVVDIRRMSPENDLGDSLDFSSAKNLAQIGAGYAQAVKSRW